MPLNDFTALDFNAARRYPGGVNKYLFDFLNFINEHGGGGEGTDDYNKLQNLPYFKVPSKLLKGGLNNPRDLDLEDVNLKVDLINSSESEESLKEQYPSVFSVLNHTKPFNDRLNSVEAQAEQFEGLISNLGNDVSELQGDVEPLKTTVSALNTDVSALKTNVSALTDSKEDKSLKVDTINVDKEPLQKTQYPCVKAVIDYVNTVHENSIDTAIFIRDKDTPLPKFYVSERGDDDNPGLTTFKPFITLQKALTKAYDGDTICNRYANYYLDTALQYNAYVSSPAINIVRDGRNQPTRLICKEENTNNLFFNIERTCCIIVYKHTFVSNTGEEVYFDKLVLQAGVEERLYVDFEYIKAQKSNLKSFTVDLVETTNNYEEYIEIDGKLEEIGNNGGSEFVHADWDETDSSKSSFIENKPLERLNEIESNISNLSSNKQDKLVSGVNIKKLSIDEAEIDLTGEGTVVIPTGSGGASSYKSLPDQPTVEGNTLISSSDGDNSADSLGLARKDHAHAEYADKTDVETVTGRVDSIESKICTDFYKTSTIKSPSCKAIADYVDTVISNLNMNNTRF